MHEKIILDFMMYIVSSKESGIFKIHMIQLKKCTKRNNQYERIPKVFKKISHNVALGCKKNQINLSLPKL